MVHKLNMKGFYFDEILERDEEIATNADKFEKGREFLKKEFRHGQRRCGKTSTAEELLDGVQ